MKIGVAVLTYKRPKHLELWLSQYSKYKSDNMSLYVVDDSFERKGVAARTNECINKFKDFDYIFIFNDDVFTIKKGWDDCYINTGWNHLLYFKETAAIEKVKSNGGVDMFTNCGGCLMFITKEVIEKVGYLNSAYSYYGYEHAGYSMRVYKSGLIPHPYAVPTNASDYIYSLDFQNDIDFGIKHHSSVDINEVENFLVKNKNVFLQDIKTIYHPYGN